MIKMRYFFLFVLLQAVFFLLLAQRPDLNSSGFLPFTNDKFTSCYQTQAAKTYYCNYGTYAYGFQLRQYEGGYGIANIMMDCREISYDANISAWSKNSSHIISNSDNYSGNFKDSEWVFCNENHGKDFIRGYSLLMYCPEYFENDLSSRGIIQVRMNCSFKSEIQPAFPVENFFSLTGFSTCTKGFAACGYKMERFSPESYGKKYAAVDIRFECCRICDREEGFFFNEAQKECDFCDITCKECSIISTNCTKCHVGYILTSTNFCQEDYTFSYVTAEFLYNTDIFNWKGVPLMVTYCSGLLNFIGIFGGLNTMSKFNKDSVATKNFVLDSHIAVLVLVHIYKIGYWTSGGIIISIDGNQVYFLEINDLDDPLYYNGRCENMVYLQSTKKIEIQAKHSSGSLSIEFKANYTSIFGYWGLNRFKVLKAACHKMCLTCSGPASNQCTSCTSEYYLQGSSCVLSCESPNFILIESATKSCINDCPSNYYKSLGDSLCVSKCPSGRFGLPYTGNCENACPYGMYGDANSSMCLFCGFNCETCENVAEYCLKCKYYWLTRSIDGKCIPLGISTYYFIFIFLFFYITSHFFVDYSEIETNTFPSKSLTPYSVQWNIKVPTDAIKTDYSSMCGNYKMLGGHENFGANAEVSKYYSTLDSHNYFRINFFFMKIGNWSNKSLIVQIDGATTVTLFFNQNDDSFAYNLCGSSLFPEALRTIDIFIPHLKTTVDIVIKSDLDLDATQASWGIFNLSLSIYDLCHKNCKTCNQTNNENQCLSCLNNLLLQAPVGPAACLASCPPRYFPNIVDNICEECDISCENCTASAKNCTECAVNYFLLYPPGPSPCSTDCDEGYYKNESFNHCSKCNSSCKTCSNSESCDSCNNGSFLLKTANYCVTSCPNKTFENFTSNICEGCDVSCELCSSFGCTKCADPYFLLKPSGPSVCSIECEEGYYKNYTANECRKCNGSCRTCSNSENNCNSCNNGTFLLKTANFCVSVCPNKTFENFTSNMCEDCDASCELCSNSGCTKCVNSYYLLKPPGPSVCSAYCSAGTYKNENISECTNCNSSCKTCSDAINCESCDIGTYLQNSSDNTVIQCLNSCPSGTFKNSTSNSCQSCDISCKECSNSEKNGCIKCESPYFLSNSPGPSTCSLNCGEGTYKEESLNECKKCNSICKTCSDSQNCESCSNGSYLYLNYCVKFCSNHYYHDNSANKCENCDISCEQCTGSGPKNCTQCAETYTLYNISSGNYGKCLIEVTPLIKNTSNPLIYHLVFPKKYSETYLLYLNQTKINIEGLNSSQYSFQIYQSSENNEIFILELLDLKFSVTNYPKMSVELNPPDVILENSSFFLKEIALENYMQHFFFQEIDFDLINKTAETTEILYDFVIVTFLAYNCFTSKAGLLSQEMLGFTSLQFLKFYQINFPENFVYNFKGLTNNLNSLETENPKKYGELADNFRFYRVSSLIWNNIALIFLQILIVWSVAIFALYLSQNEKIMSFNQHLKKIVNILVLLLVWNFPLSLYLSKSMEIFFYTILVFRFFTKVRGFFNVSTAVISVIVNIFIIIFLALKTRKLNKSSASKSEKLKKNEDFSQDNKEAKLKNEENSVLTKKKSGNDEENLDLSLQSPLPLKEKNELNSLKKKNMRENSDQIRYSCLVLEVKHENFYQTYFVLWGLFKYLLHALIICAFFEIPFEGLIVEIVLTIVFIGSIIIWRPYKEAIDLFFFALNEIILLCAIILTLIIAIEGKKNIPDQDYLMNLGWGIIFLNFALIANYLIKKLVLGIIFIWKNFDKIYDPLKKYMESRKKKKTQNEIKRKN